MTPMEQRFWAQVRKGRGCWTWVGNLAAKGYGKIRTAGRGSAWLYAHRASWQLHNGPIPNGLCVLHRCDNPPCVNPEHLWLGTWADNNRDMALKGRARNQNSKRRQT